MSLREPALDEGTSSSGTVAAGPTGTADPTPNPTPNPIAAPPFDHPALRPSLLPSIVGAIVAITGLVLVGTALTGNLYVVDFELANTAQFGPQTPTANYEIHYRMFDSMDSIDGETDLDSYLEDDPEEGRAVRPLLHLTIVGLALAATGSLMAILHRFRLLTVEGPAAVFVAAGAIMLAIGLIWFSATITEAIRSSMFSNARLDPTPAFFTINARGDFVDNLNMAPGAAYWRHIAGTTAVVIGGLLLHWNDIVRLRD